MATHDNRDPALYDGNRGARHRLAPRQDAQAALIKRIECHACLGAAVARKRRCYDRHSREGAVALPLLTIHTDAAKVADFTSVQ